jgi:hypothetical protein
MIYCHYDGYIAHTGKILQEHYSSQERVEELVSLGDLSQLAERVSPLGASHSFDNREKGTCVYYGRDRGDAGTEPQTVPDDLDSREEEYLYVWVGNRWLVSGAYWEGWTRLEDELHPVSA